MVDMPPASEPTAAPRALSMLERVLFVGCGAALLVGFFMPWVKAGELLTVSGFGLSVAQGDMVGMVAGAHSFLLLAVPAVGLLLVAGGLVGHRATAWLAVAGAFVILGYGLYTLVVLFISSTGLGMWLVVAASILSLGLGLAGIARRRAR